MKATFNLFSYNLLSIFALNLLLLFALSWIVWGEFIPPAGSLGFLECIGLFIGLSGLNLLLERMPELLKRPKGSTPQAYPQAVAKESSSRLLGSNTPGVTARYSRH